MGGDVGLSRFCFAGKSAAAASKGLIAKARKVAASGFRSLIYSGLEAVKEGGGRRSVS